MSKIGVEPGRRDGCCGRMSKADDEKITTDPLEPEPLAGLVKIVDPPAAAIILTADAAEISALKLLDAADRAREIVKPVGRKP